MKHFPQILGTLILALTCAANGQVVSETNYSAQNFNTNNDYARGFSIIATNQPANLRWNGNDPYNTNNSPATGETDAYGRRM
jgi:hypothetical protein